MQLLLVNLSKIYGTFLSLTTETFICYYVKRYTKIDQSEKSIPKLYQTPALQTCNIEDFKMHIAYKWFWVLKICLKHILGRKTKFETIPSTTVNSGSII